MHELLHQTRQLREQLNAEVAQRRRMSETLAKVVHELRTPVSGVIGFARLLLQDPGVTPEQLVKLRLIESCCLHQLQVVDDVIDLARLSARKLQLAPAPADLGELLCTAVEMVRPLADGRGISLGLELPDVLPQRLVLDAQRLRQVLFNLLSNAIKYTDVGGVVLRVTPSGRDADGRHRLAFAVCDSGRGLVRAGQEPVVELFRRGHEGAQAPPGSGIGLVVTHELLLLMGAELGFVERFPSGTEARFELSLPAA